MTTGFADNMTRIIIAIWAATLAVDQALLYDRFNPKEVPIFTSRIARVPDDQQPRALHLLGDKDFLRLAQSDLSGLFGGKGFNYEGMLSAQAEAADSYAIKREHEAAIPFFKERREAFLEEAKAHRDYSRYTRSLSARLIPYLVKSRVYFEGTGSFFVKLSEKHMTVSHESLGRSTPRPTMVAIVIFAEHEVATVSVTLGISQ